MRTRLLVLFLILSCVQPAFGSDGLSANYAEVALEERRAFITENGDLVFTGVEVAGLERTRPHVITREFRYFAGKPLSQVDIEFALDRLHRKGIFAKIVLEFEKKSENEAIIKVVVTDKWTLIPVPVVNITRGIQTYGLFLYEPNLLGRHKTLFLGFLGSNIGLQGLAGYMDHHLNNTDWYFEQIIEAGKVRHDNGDPGGSQFESYEVTFAKISSRIGYRFANIFLPTLLVKTKFSEVASDDTLDSTRAVSANSVGIGPRLYLEWITHRGYYREGLEGWLDILHGFAITDDGSSYDEIIGGFRYTLPAFLDHSVSSTVLFAYGDVTAVYENRLGGQEGSRTLPADFIAADRFFSHTLRYEHPVFTPDWGVFTLTEFFESGVYQRDGGTPGTFYGPGIGFRFYLRDLALPALGFDYAYEIQTNSSQLSFAFGFVR